MYGNIFSLRSFILSSSTMWATNHAEITRENSERRRDERRREERLGDEPTSERRGRGTTNIQKTSALRHAGRNERGPFLVTSGSRYVYKFQTQVLS